MTSSNSSVRVMIVEDEPLIAMQLEALTMELGHCVVGAATTMKQAVTIASANPPDLILSDVQLADGSCGIEAVSRIRGERNTPVIFITAYPERLLTGEGPEPIFLISKPFDSEAVKATIGQALFLELGSI